MRLAPAQVAVGEIGRLADDPAQLRLAEIGAGELGAVDRRFLRQHDRVVELAVLVGGHQEPVADVRAREVGALEIGALQHRAPQVDAAEIGVGQARVGQVRAEQVGARQVRAAEIAFGQVGADELGLGEVAVVQVVARRHAEIDLQAHAAALLLQEAFVRGNAL